jgi:outer membrane lipoprotein carrier protein
MQAKALFALFFFVSPIAFAKAAKTAKNSKPAKIAKVEFSPALLSVVDKYKASGMVTMKVVKKVKQELLGTEKEYTGKVSLSGEKFRLDTETPDQALLLFDGKTIWSVQFPSKELGGVTQVLKSPVNKQNRSQILLSALLDKTSLQKNFKVMNERKTNGLTQVTVAPLTSDLTVKSVDLTVDSKKGLLDVISYIDDVGNLTTMTFSDIQFQKKAQPKFFKYVPPADAQVTNL